MVQFLKKNVFWVLQVFGWALVALLVTGQSIVKEHFFGRFLFFLGIFLAGLIATSILRWGLKKWILITEFNISVVLRILLIILGSTLLQLGLNYGFGYLGGYLAGAFGVSEELVVKQNLNFGSVIFIISYVVYVFIQVLWTFFYYGIKAAIDYNDKRVKRVRLKEEVKIAQLKTLRGNLSPSFLVSSLKNIKRQMVSDVKGARNSLTLLAELLRYSLSKNDIDWVGLREELEMVENYVSLVSLEGKMDFRLNINIDNPEKFQIPPMLIFGFVEIVINASEHTNAESLELELVLDDVVNSLKIEVNGIFLKGNENTVSLKIKSLRSRLFLLFGNRATLKVPLNPADESCYLLQFPVNLTKEVATV